MKIRKGDQVQIISGKDRGKRGKVIRVLPKSGKLVVEGINLVKKHRRPRKGGEKGQRVEIPTPLASSKVKLICPHCGKPTRVGYKIEKSRKIRMCKVCKGDIQ
ncbi:MAG: 50S ribosomal protein L24 [Candidatus Moranbacteria bacterium]|nr:50S ribosomal protein L24 [Candidatus Moranbacteria bacterium]